MITRAFHSKISSNYLIKNSIKKFDLFENKANIFIETKSLWIKNEALNPLRPNSKE